MQWSALIFSKREGEKKSSLNPELIVTNLLSVWKDEALNVGRIGLTLIVAGMVGSVIGGIVLDKTHRFK